MSNEAGIPVPVSSTSKKGFDKGDYMVNKNWANGTVGADVGMRINRNEITMVTTKHVGVVPLFVGQ